jgi:hypothetical protein
MEGVMVWGVHADNEARPGAMPRPGAPVDVRRSRGRLATRPGHVLDVAAFGGASVRGAIGVRWDDDGSVSWLVPGSDIEVTGADRQEARG